MSDRCVACGEQTVYEPEAGSAICTQCGTLVDPSQNVLASHLEHIDVSGHDYHLSYVTGATNTLKGRNGWALAGQDKETQHRRNTISMHQYLRSLASRLSSAASVVRAQGIFDQAMERGQFRWGRKAKLVAGASLAIALRESHKSDSLRDIAYLLDEPPLAVTRTFTTVTELLHLKLSPADPTQHLPVLEAHVLSLLQSPASRKSIPGQLTATLAPLIPKLTNVRNTASSLSSFVVRTPALANMPTSSTACAILILALEGELGASLPVAGSLAEALGARVGASKAVVMQRYKTIYDAIEECIRDVPWLEGHERKAQGKGRSKVAKRVVVARGLKDVVQFQDEIWRKKLEAVGKPVLDIEVEESGDVTTDDTGVAGSVGGESPLEPATSRGDALSCVQPNKIRRSMHERDVQRASQFLLNPLAQPAYGREGGARNDLLEHLLTADTAALTHAFLRPPTRLQMLAASRGGGEEDKILDHELFDEGEMEALLRDPGEVEALRLAFDWTHEDGDETHQQSAAAASKKRKRSVSDDGRPDGNAKGSETTKRINMDALARLLDPDSRLDEDFGEKDDGELHASLHAPYTFSPDAEEIVEEWRPLSPGPGGSFDEDRYDT